MALRTEDGDFAGDLLEVMSSWLARKDAIPESWKEDTNPICPMVYCELQKLGLTGCSELMTRARRNASRLRALSGFFNDLSSAFQIHSNIAQSNYGVVSNMCSLVTLPNELLVRIFGCVVNGDRGLAIPVRWKAAITLSHVNQYFRDTALSCAQMWSNISEKMNITELCIARSGCAPLDLRLVIGCTVSEVIYGLRIQPSLTPLLPLLKRWRTLDIEFVPHLREDDVRLVRRSASSIRQAFCGAQGSSLESLRIICEESRYWFFDLRKYREFEGWDAPKLRHITVVDYFPLSFPALANVTYLNMSLGLGEIDLVDVLRNIARMEVLEDFTMKLTAQVDKYHRDAIFSRSFEKTELSSVRRLKIEIEHRGAGIYRLPVEPELLLKPLFSSLTFPCAVDLHVSLSGALEKLYPGARDHDKTHSLTTEATCVFQHSGQFPLVERFRFEANALNPNRRGERPMEEDKVCTFLPIHILPSLMHFTLCCNNQLAIEKIKIPKEETINPSAPTIKTITVEMPSEFVSDGHIGRYVSRLLRKLKKGGKWADFHELVIVDTDIDPKERINQAYEGMAALAWSDACSKSNGSSTDEDSDEEFQYW